MPFDLSQLPDQPSQGQLDLSLLPDQPTATSKEGGGFVDLIRMKAGLPPSEPFPTSPVQRGIGKAFEGIVPHSMEDVKAMLMLPRPSEFETTDLPASEELGAAWRGEYGPEAQAQAITGTLLQGLPLAHLPFAETPMRAGPRDLALADTIRKARAEAETPPPIPPKYAERRFTMQPTPPEPRPAFAPAPTLESILAGLREPLPFNPEAGPVMRPEFQMPVRTETAQLSDLIQQQAQPRIVVPPERVQPGEFAKPGYTALPTEPTATRQGEGMPPWMRDQVDALAGPLEKNGVADVIEDLAAQRLTAKQIADKLGLEVTQVLAVRVKRGIPSMNMGGGGPQISPEFEAWANARQARAEPAAAPVPAPSVEIPEADRPYAGGAPQAEPIPGIANRYLEEQIAAGTLPEEALVAGQGTTQAKAVAAARAELAADPNAGFKAARRVTAGKMLPGDPARLHAYGDALAEASGQAGKAAIENPNMETAAAAKAAEQAHIDFLQNVLPKAKGMAQETMVGFQGAVPPDLATFTGMQKELLEFNGGKPLTPQQRMELYRRDQRGTRLKAQERNGLDRMQTEMDRTMPRTKIPDPAQMQAEMAKFIDRATPCT